MKLNIDKLCFSAPPVLLVPFPGFSLLPLQYVLILFFLPLPPLLFFALKYSLLVFIQSPRAYKMKFVKLTQFRKWTALEDTPAGDGSLSLKV